jgi:hypothetical protein
MVKLTRRTTTTKKKTRKEQEIWEKKGKKARGGTWGTVE